MAMYRLPAGLAIVLSACCPLPAACSPLPDDAQTFLNTYCLKCHQGEKPKGKLDLSGFRTAESMAAEAKTWGRLLNRVRDGEMPPSGSDAPPAKLREQFVDQIRTTLIAAVCADGPRAGPNDIRRLNRTEYAATIRDLLGVEINAAQRLPDDGAGGEGFDNAAETLTWSPLHTEKYLDAAKEALEYAFKEPRSRRTFLVSQSGPETPPTDAARAILTKFLPRAFRRPLRDGELDEFLALFTRSQKRGDPFDQSVLIALQGVLISPHFLLRLEEPNTDANPRPLGDYELASRLSYFLWASMPDDQLFRLAANGKLNDESVLREQAARLHKSTKARDFSESFVEQWLGTRELGRSIKPDRAVHTNYTNELEWAIRMEPVLFFQGLLAEDRPLTELLDANYTYLDTRLMRHYGLNITGSRLQSKRLDLPANSHRGGLLGMAAVLTVSSYPHRTSPVLRGKWVRETILGSPPPPPPPDVPELNEKSEAAAAKSIRELLEKHRQNPTCSSCHNSIDPIGFGMENYDVLGRWRAEEAGKPVDAKGELPDGTKFDGPDELKRALLLRKDDFLRHLTTKLLGFALGRGLTIEDQCAVEEIFKKVKANDYKAQVLIAEIVCSKPFRFVAADGKRAQPPRNER